MLTLIELQRAHAGTRELGEDRYYFGDEKQRMTRVLAALLLAPTISAISSVEMRSAWPVIAPDEAERTEVVMPMFDAFCPPSQVEDYRAAGVTVHVVRDDHVMCSRDAVDTIAARVLALVRQADDADEG